MTCIFPWWLGIIIPNDEYCSDGLKPPTRRDVKKPWHQFGLPCLIRSHFVFWIWGQVVLEPEQHPKNIHVRTSVASAATTFDLDAVEVTCAVVRVFGIFHFPEFNLQFVLFRRVTLVWWKALCNTLWVELWLMVPGMILLRTYLSRFSMLQQTSLEELSAWFPLSHKLCLSYRSKLSITIIN